MKIFSVSKRIVKMIVQVLDFYIHSLRRYAVVSASGFFTVIQPYFRYKVLTCTCLCNFEERFFLGEGHQIYSKYLQTSKKLCRHASEFVYNCKLYFDKEVFINKNVTGEPQPCYVVLGDHSHLLGSPSAVHKVLDLVCFNPGVEKAGRRG